MKRFLIAIVVLTSMMIAISDANANSWSSSGVRIGVGFNSHGGVAIRGGFGYSSGHTSVRASGVYRGGYYGGSRGVYRGGYVGRRAYYGPRSFRAYHPVYVPRGYRPYRPVYRYYEPQTYGNIIPATPIYMNPRVATPAPAVFYGPSGEVRSIVYNEPAVVVNRAIGSGTITKVKESAAPAPVDAGPARRAKEVEDMRERIHKAKMGKLDIEYTRTMLEMEHELAELRRSRN
jgi:hypothetical protein